MYWSANQAVFLDSKLNHTIMWCSKLCNKFLKSRSNKDRKSYKKQQSICVSLLRQNEEDYFETLDIESITDNKMFWKTEVPLFSNKSKASNKILSEDEKLIINDQKCSLVFNNYFNSIVKELNNLYINN